MPEYDPFPDEIEERSAEVRETWDEETTKTRKAHQAKRHRPKGWTPPIVSVSELKGAIQDTFDVGE